MYRILTTQDLTRLGFTSEEIRRARRCCLLRLSRGVYVARHVCTIHSHRPLWASIEENAHDEFTRYGDIRDQTEALHAAVMARCELKFRRRQDSAGDHRSSGYAAAPGQRSEEKPEIFSHVSAALIHGLPIAYPVTHQVEVFRPGVDRRFKSIHVRSSTVPKKHQVRVMGARVTTLERTLIDVARSYSLDISVAMLDSALHRNLTTLDRITTTLSECAEKRNTKRVRLALDLADGRRESPAESIAAVRFYQHGLSGLDPQVVLGSESFSVRVDFCHRSARLIVEVDGIGKLYLGSGVPREELEKERRREHWLREHGYRVIRITWKELFQERKFQEIKQVLMRAA
ncbi:very-short-patch-repair endonuclease [Brevibacterium sanguinis]|uniref:Very-short-patch-repair endonuclease n=3 Tax=Brevibacteriaceae TaxID=85019 RepID=A0A366IG06_9MICO|nr:very-short-patch-repair endonuclease [Brevibacterium sanguinis]RBP70322.1 very-short-patch-repair endonuclease [Brevibacterium celere]